MAVRNTNLVGNAWMYIGVPYHNRKSYPRNSKGFEPLEAYFTNKPIQDSESDSDSGTEELVQQEYQRRLEARHKQQAADKEKPSSSKSDSEVAQPSHVNSSNIQSAHNDAVSNGTNHNLTVQSDPEGILQDSNKDETIIESRPISSEQKAIATLDVQQSKSTVSSTTLNATEGVNTASTLGLHISSASNSEDLYSPGKSIIERSSPAPSQKFHPSRLSFGGSSSDNESNTRVAPPLSTVSSTTQSTKQRKKRKTITFTTSKRKSLRNAAPTKADSTIAKPVSTNTTDGSSSESTTQHQSVTSERVSTALENGVSTQVSVSGIDSVTNSTMSFNPPKTSTQNSKKDVEREKHTGAKKRKPATPTKREISRIGPERNKQTLRIMDSDSEEENPNDTLQMLLGGAVSRMQSLQSRVAGTLAAKLGDENKVPDKLKASTSQKSKVVSAEEKMKYTRKSARKSVNFSKEPSSIEPDEPPLKKSHVSPSKSASNGTVLESHQSSHGDLVIDNDDSETVKKDSFTPKRKSFLKVRNVSIVLTKSASPDSSQGSSTTSSNSIQVRAKTSQPNRGRETTKSKGKRKYSRAQDPTINGKSVSKKKLQPLRQQDDVSDIEQPMIDSESDGVELVPLSDSEPTTQSSNSKDNAIPVKSKRKFKRVRSSTVKHTESRRQTSRSKRKALKSPNVGVDSDSDQAMSGMDHFPDPVSPLHTTRDKSNQRKTSSSSGTSTSQTVHGDQSSIDVSVLPKIHPRKRKKMARCVIPMKRHKTGPITSSNKPDQTRNRSQTAKSAQDTESNSNNQDESSFDSDSDGHDVTTSPGGRQYRRLGVTNAVARTPGVRRSQRTRIAPVRPWLNEKIDYEMRRKSGVSLKGVLVPMYDVDGEAPRAKTKQPQQRKTKEAVEMVDGDFQKLEFEDSMGNVVDDKVVVKTFASASKVNGRGQPIDEDTEVIVSRLFASNETSNGLVTFSSFAEKGRCATKTNEMYFLVLSGKLSVQINHQEYKVQQKMVIHVPAGSVYNIRNTQRTKAEVFFYSLAVPQDS